MRITDESSPGTCVADEEKRGQIVAPTDISRLGPSCVRVYPLIPAEPRIRWWSIAAAAVRRITLLKYLNVTDLNLSCALSSGQTFKLVGQYATARPGHYIFEIADVQR